MNNVMSTSLTNQMLDTNCPCFRVALGGLFLYSASTVLLFKVSSLKKLLDIICSFKLKCTYTLACMPFPTQARRWQNRLMLTWMTLLTGLPRGCVDNGKGEMVTFVLTKSCFFCNLNCTEVVYVNCFSVCDVWTENVKNVVSGQLFRLNFSL